MRAVHALFRVGFAVQVTTRLLLFSSEATKCYTNLAFRLKMIMILLAGLKALLFHTTVYRRVDLWGENSPTPMGAKVAGTFSILLWFGIVAAGRWDCVHVECKVRRARVGIARDAGANCRCEKNKGEEFCK
jgi:hypothetical protein